MVETCAPEEVNVGFRSFESESLSVVRRFWFLFVTLVMVSLGSSSGYSELLHHVIVLFSQMLVSVDHFFFVFS